MPRAPGVPGGTGAPAVLLDIDDTLVDTRWAFGQALDVVLDRWAPDLPARARAQAVRDWRADVHGYFAAYTRGEIGMGEQRRLRAEALHRSTTGRPLPAGSWPEWEATYDGAFRAAWRLREGAAELVGALAARGVPFGALTNLQRSYQEEKLRVVGLSDLPVLVAVDDLGFGKPDPRVFAEALRRLQAPAGPAVYVGDEPEVDVGGARAAGLIGVLACPATSRAACPDPGHHGQVEVVHDLTDLLGVLDDLEDGRHGGVDLGEGRRSG